MNTQKTNKPSAKEQQEAKMRQIKLERALAAVQALKSIGVAA